MDYSIQLDSEQVSLYPLRENEVVIWIYSGQLQSWGLSRTLAAPPLSPWAAVWLPEALLGKAEALGYPGPQWHPVSGASSPALPSKANALLTVCMLSATLFC